MARNRIIFALLYADGHFMLSRNFRLQRIGDVRWLLDNYKFGLLAESIDELFILDVSRNNRNTRNFIADAAAVVADCFVPVGFGGGIRDMHQVSALMRAGADKVVINTAALSDPEFIDEVASEVGAQSIAISVDVLGATSQKVVSENGTRDISRDLRQVLEVLTELPFGELILTSIDRDGTGMGLDLALLDAVPSKFSHPVILSGGVGNAAHVDEAWRDGRTSAVATANLLNFVGDGLVRAREDLRSRGHDLARFDRWEPMGS